MFDYHVGQSLVHRMNPLIKLACAAPLILAATLSLAVIPSAVFATATFAIAFGPARLPVRRFVRTLLPYLLLAVGFFWFYAIATGKPDELTLLEIGPLRVTPISLNNAIAIALRVVTIMSLTVTFLMTTTPNDFILSLIHQLHMDQRVAFGMFAAIRFMPIAETELTKIRQAHRIRGVGERAGIRGAFRRFRRYAIPLFSSVIRMAQRTALAMDLKAFAVYPNRSYLRRTYVTKVDVAALAFVVGFVVLVSVFMLVTGFWTGFSLSNLQGQPGR